MKKEKNGHHPPYFPFYPGDYLSDASVLSMSIEGEGCYIRLMSINWKEGFIPSDREAIVRLCKGYGGPGIDEAMSCFSITRNKQQLTHKRLERERLRQVEYHNSRKSDGLRGAEKRWGGYREANHTLIAKNSSSSSSSSSSSEDKNKNKNKKEISKKKSCPGKIPDEQDIKLVQLLIELMEKNNPGSSILKRLTPKRQSEWVNQCRLLREVDKHTPEEIETVIKFSQEDSFWKTNILSTYKLREKWDQLFMKARRSSGVEKYDGITRWVNQEEEKEKNDGTNK